MAGLDLNKYYQTLVQSGYDPIDAAQITAYQYIDNPSGSITKIKLPPKWYTEQDYYEYSAPDFLAAANYVGDDEVANKVATFVTSENFTLPGISAFVRANRSIFGDSDGYAQLKDLYDQKESARKSYEKQLETHEFSQYGLPDPTTRYSVMPGVRKNAQGRAVQYVAYQPAIEYVDKQVTNYYNNLRNSGLSETDAQKNLQRYQNALMSAVDQKISQAAISPFLDKVAELRKIKK
jgi:hypothetical protein